MAVTALAAWAQIPPDALRVDGDQLSYDADAKRWTVEGHALLVRGGLQIRADRLTYDETGHHLQASGHVLLVNGLFAGVAEKIDADVTHPDAFEASLEHFTGWQKRAVTTEALAAAKSAEQLQHLGTAMLVLTGKHLKRIGPDRFEVDDLSFTPCDCDADKPSWRISAKHGDIEMGERALLTNALIYLGQEPDHPRWLWPLPVLPLPVLYLPLEDRRSGLLVPRPMSSSLNGFSIDQPIFLTLGRSWDLTLTPGYYFGRSLDPAVPPSASTAFGIKGPRLLTELNYAPSEKTSGRVTFDLIDDLRAARDPVDLTIAMAGQRGVRGEASIRHVQDLGNGFYDRVDAALLSDAYYWKDLTTDVLLSSTQYLRSTAVVYHRDANSYLGLDTTLRQDIRLGYNLFGRQTDSQGYRSPATLERLPSLVFALPDRPLLGPLWGGLRLEYTRISPLLGQNGDEGVTGYYTPCPVGTPCLASAGEGDRMFEAGEREARDRIDFRPHAMASLPVGNWLRVLPYAAYRQDVYLGEITGQTAERGYGLGGAQAETELSRVWTTAGGTSLRHTVSPNVEVRGVPFTTGAVPTCGSPPRPCAYDEIDAAIPGAALNPLSPADVRHQMLQGVAAVRQTLAVKQGASVKQLLQLDLGQGFDLLQDRPADAFGRLVAGWGAFTSTSVVHYDSGAHRLAQLTAEAMLDDFRGDAVYARFDRLLQGGSDPLRAGLDSLVGQPYAGCTVQDQFNWNQPGTPCQPTYAEQVVAGFRFKLPVGLAARYEAIIQPTAPPSNPPVSGIEAFGQKFTQQVAAVSYGPACDCWRVEAHALFHPGTPVPDLGLSLTISRFGTFGN